jgi:hypothetical protein
VFFLYCGFKKLNTWSPQCRNGEISKVGVGRKKLWNFQGVGVINYCPNMVEVYVSPIFKTKENIVQGLVLLEY